MPVSSNHEPANSSKEFKISKEASDISSELTERIKTKIRENGCPINFEIFMQMALYEPQLGYYQNKLHKFGEKGDFITAPEMGSLFAECIADSIIGSLKSEYVGSILEIGAGSGRLAVDLIKALKHQNELPAQYFILEPSATLQSQQKQLIEEELFEKDCPELLNRIEWLADLPTNFEGVIIANEVIDAIPCQIIEKTEQGWFYKGVDLVDDELCNCLIEKVELDDLPIQLTENNDGEDYILGYQAEIRKQASGWLLSLSNCLAKGHILLIDYGYPASELYHPQRIEGSLTCFINHHQHSNYLKAIGIQDITTHVDFTNIAIEASQHGLTIEGFTTQAGFLLENGIIEKAEVLLASNENMSLDIDRYKISQQIQKLMMPGQMGEVLKVISLSTDLNNDDLSVKNTKVPLKGFSMQDHLHRL